MFKGLVQEETVSEVLKIMRRSGVDEPFEEFVDWVEIPGLAEARRRGDLEGAQNIRRDWVKANGDRKVLISWADIRFISDWRKAKFCLR